MIFDKRYCKFSSLSFHECVQISLRKHEKICNVWNSDRLNSFWNNLWLNGRIYRKFSTIKNGNKASDEISWFPLKYFFEPKKIKTWKESIGRIVVETMKTKLQFIIKCYAHGIFMVQMIGKCTENRFSPCIGIYYDDIIFIPIKRGSFWYNKVIIFARFLVLLLGWFRSISIYLLELIAQSKTKLI